MSAGMALRLLECIVTVWCGTALAVRPFKMRWARPAAKVVFGIAIVFITVLRMGNAYFAKYSMTEYWIAGVWLLIFVPVFFRVRFWQLLAQVLMYWSNLSLIHYYFIYIGCVDWKISFWDYIMFYVRPWHWLHMAGMALIIFVSLVLCGIMKEGMLKGLSGSRRSFKMIDFLLVTEFFVSQAVFTSEKSMIMATVEEALLFGLFFFLCITAAVIFVLLKAYDTVKRQEQLLAGNYQMICRQYETVSQSYEARRRQFHDMMQKNLMVYQLLENEKYDEARTRVAGFIGEMKEMQKNHYTGLTELDFLVDYKVSQATEVHIRFDMAFDVAFCPLEKEDLFVLFGNLFDNATEAVVALEAAKRTIEVRMKTVRSAFFASIKNPYEGCRCIRDGRYVTTKKDKALHGMGLEGVRRIVEKYNGDMEIRDDGRYFEVSITFFEKNR